MESNFFFLTLYYLINVASLACLHVKGGLYFLGVWTQWACRRYDAVNFNLYHILKRGSADVIPRHNARGTITNKLDCVIAGSVGLRGSDYNFINSNSVLHLPNKYRKLRTISRYFFPTLWALRPILRAACTTVRPILRPFCFNSAKSILPRIIRSIRLTNRSYVHVLWIAYAIHKTWLWATAGPRSTVADQRGVQVDRYGPFRGQ